MSRRDRDDMQERILGDKSWLWMASPEFEGTCGGDKDSDTPSAVGLGMWARQPPGLARQGKPSLFSMYKQPQNDHRVLAGPPSLPSLKAQRETLSRAAR